MNIVSTVVEVGVILAARGMYDAEVGSSGGKCGLGPWIEVIEESAGIIRGAPSVAWFAMYRSNKYKVETN